MKICVVGVGYVGLVTATCLAEAGNDVVCVDNDENRIAALLDGVIPIYEPGLTELVQHNQKLGRLHFTTELKAGVDHALVLFIAVGTPPSEDGSPDMSAVHSVAEDIAEHLTDYRIIATKSTVPVGTCRVVTDIIKSATDVPFDYVSNPEFLKEGSAIEDFMRPDRVIIGTDNPEVQATMKTLYAPFMRKSSRILFMDTISAELTKYAANAMLATRISFINEISELCEKIGVNVEQIRRGLGSDSRIGSAFLFPGVGFGGSCIPKDVRALIHTGAAQGLEMTMAESVVKVNVNARERFAARIKDYCGRLDGETALAVWGLAFKARTDDVRESPAIYCIRKLLDSGIRIRAYDPEAGPNAVRELQGGIELSANAYDALEGADALVIFTDWQEFRNPDLQRVAAALKRPVIFDGRNLYEPDVVRAAGLEYHSVGRRTVVI